MGGRLSEIGGRGSAGALGFEFKGFPRVRSVLLGTQHQGFGLRVQALGLIGVAFASYFGRTSLHGTADKSDGNITHGRSQALGCVPLTMHPGIF